MCNMPKSDAAALLRSARWRAKAGAAGLVRVSVMVPQTRVDEIRAIAASFRQLGRVRAEVLGLPRRRRRNAGAPWSAADRRLLVRVWTDGGDGAALADALARPMAELAAELVAQGEAGSAAEVEIEFARRKQAEG